MEPKTPKKKTRAKKPMSAATKAENAMKPTVPVMVEGDLPSAKAPVVASSPVAPVAAPVVATPATPAPTPSVVSPTGPPPPPVPPAPTASPAAVPGPTAAPGPSVVTPAGGSADEAARIAREASEKAAKEAAEAVAARRAGAIASRGLGFGGVTGVGVGAIVGGMAAYLGSTEENRGAGTFLKGAAMGAAGGSVVSAAASRGMISGGADWIANGAKKQGFDTISEFAKKGEELGEGMESADGRKLLFASGAMLAGGIFGTNRNRAQGMNANRGNRFGG